MIPEHYWKREDTPMQDSSTANAMRRLHKLYPELALDECLERAREALDQAAGRKHYTITIFSREQKQAQQKRTEAWIERCRSKGQKSNRERGDIHGEAD